MIPKLAVKIAHKLLPHTRWGDALYHRVRFWHFHRRWPVKKSMLLNDFMFELMCGSDIDLPLRRRVSDKEYAKDYIRERVGDEFNVPTIAVLRSFDEAVDYKYPSRCVIKATHASGRVILRRAGEPINYSVIKKWFSFDYYSGSRERCYLGLRPKVIVEPFVFDCDAPLDYKVFCWRGEPRMIQVILNRFSNKRFLFFDAGWNEQPFSFNFPRHIGSCPRPKTLPLMMALARALSIDFSFVRIDFYTDGSKVAVGELTSVPAGGLYRFIPTEAEVAASRLLFGGDFTSQ
jgi:hypothetical protein